MKKDNDLTVMVFGNPRASRTFLLPPEWISRIGMLLCVISVIALVSGGLAFRFYRIAAKAEPWKIKELEQKLAEAQEAKRQAETPPTPEPNAPTAGPAVIGAVQSLSNQQGLFTGLPLKAKTPATGPLTIEIGDLKSDWNGKSLDVYFNLRYSKGDGGNQQGHILILARGPSLLQIYPTGALNPPGSAALISPEKGEYFSVSRFREVKARFGPFPSREELHSVEILVLSQNDEILFHQVIQPGQHTSSPSTIPNPITNPDPASTQTSPPAPGLQKP